LQLQVFASAIGSVGIFHVLSVVNLGIDPDAPVLPTDFRRSWLLPVLKRSIRNAPLSLFMRYFLGISVKLHARIASLQPLPAKLYGTVESQLWGLLPSFLSTPTDFQEAFTTLAPILGAALNERPDLRLTVLASIRAALK
jgi:ribosomal RNA-processing protein 12